MLSVNPVSSVRFKGGQQDMESYLSRPGAYSNPVNPNVDSPKKKSSVGKTLLKLVLAAAVVAGALYGLPKMFPKVFDAAKNLDGLKGFDKYLSYTTTYIAKAGEGIGNYVLKAYNAVKNLIPHKTT